MAQDVYWIDIGLTFGVCLFQVVLSLKFGSGCCLDYHWFELWGVFVKFESWLNIFTGCLLV